MGKIFQTLIDFFSQEHWHFSQNREQLIIFLELQTSKGKWKCYAQALEEENYLVFYSLCPIKVSVHRYEDMTEFLCRANYQIPLGNFELNWDNGEIRYKTSLALKNATVTPVLIRQLINNNISMMDNFFAGIAAIAQGLSPQKTLEYLGV